VRGKELDGIGGVCETKALRVASVIEGAVDDGRVAFGLVVTFTPVA